MLRFLAFIGRQSASVLIVGLFLAAFFPTISALLRPWLGVMVSVVLGISMARLDIGSTLKSIVRPSRTIRLLSIIFVLMPVACLALIWLWRAMGFDEQYVLLLMVFLLAPPLSSSTSLCLLLGYDAVISLQVTLLGTLLTPLIGAACFSILGVEIDIPIFELGFRIAAMIGGGLLIGILLQRVIGKTNIDNHPQVFNGVAAIVMVLFLFPLFDGVVETAVGQPLTTVLVLLMALVLNFGSNLLVRRAGYSVTNPSTASALGISFGNRNVAFYLAALPINPLLSLFVALLQIPMYATPAIFGKSKSRD